MRMQGMLSVRPSQTQSSLERWLLAAGLVYGTRIEIHLQGVHMQVHEGQAPLPSYPPHLIPAMSLVAPAAGPCLPLAAKVAAAVEVADQHPGVAHRDLRHAGPTAIATALGLRAHTTA